MKGLFKTVLLCSVFLTFSVAIFANGSDEAEGEKTWVFKYGNQQPEGHSRTVSMLWFEDELESRTNGRIKVEIYHSGVLGTEKEMFEQTVTGSLQGYRGAFYDQLNPQFLLYNLPFLFQSYDEMVAFNDSDMAADMLKKGSKGGIYMPAVGFTGFRTIINRVRPIQLPEDLKGIKMRSPGQAPIINFYKLFDASPQEMAFSEVYMALKTNVLDGGDNSPTNIDSAKLYEVATYFTALNYMAGADPLMVSMSWYESLPADLQETFNQVSKEALRYWDELESKAGQESVDKIIAMPGVQGIDMAHHPDKLTAWEKACEPLWQQFVDEGYFTWDDIRRAQAIIAEVRG